MLYGWEGWFWSGKTSGMVYIAHEAKKTGAVVWSNTPLHKGLFPRQIIYNDDNFLETMRTVNAVNDYERLLYDTPASEATGGLTLHNQKKFTPHTLLLDEAWAVKNANLWASEDKAVVFYINQNRKNELNIHIGTPEGTQVTKDLRRFVESWFYSVPFMKVPILKNFLCIRRTYKHDDGRVKTESYLGRDSRGEEVMKEKPMDYSFDWYWAPFIWKMYDHLYKNIPDSDKYKINKEAFLFITGKTIEESGLLPVPALPTS